MFLTIPLELTDSLANLGKSTFESVLRDELLRDCSEFFVKNLVHEGASIDADVVDIRIGKIENVRWTRRVQVTVHVVLRKASPGAAAPDAACRFEKKHTIAFDPDADGTELHPKAYHYIDTAKWYDDEDEDPMPSAEEEAKLTDLMDRTVGKFEASILEPENPANVRKLMGIVERESKRPHSERMRSFLADFRRRLELLPRRKGDDD